MYYFFLCNYSTVTLPATLWFFDKEKSKTDKKNEILFIDGRNIFTQVDRAHRKFSDEQIKNLGIITKLYDGDSSSYKELIKEYRQNVIEHICELKIAVSKLQEYSFYFDSDNKVKYKKPKLCSCAPKIIEIDEKKFINITPELLINYKKMIKKQNENIELANKKLHFEQHYCKKQEKKIKEFDKLISDGKNSALEALYFIKNIEWLLEKFPNGRYEDILGLCKVVKIEEEDGIREQDYSLNPGRYVGVVIEDDGMTEEEFQNTIKCLNEEVKELNINSNKLLNEINKNIEEIFDY